MMPLLLAAAVTAAAAANDIDQGNMYKGWD